MTPELKQCTLNYLAKLKPVEFKWTQKEEGKTLKYIIQGKKRYFKNLASFYARTTCHYNFGDPDRPKHWKHSSQYVENKRRAKQTGSLSYGFYWDTNKKYTRKSLIERHLDKNDSFQHFFAANWRQDIPVTVYILDFDGHNGQTWEDTVACYNKFIKDHPTFKLTKLERSTNGVGGHATFLVARDINAPAWKSWDNAFYENKTLRLLHDHCRAWSKNNVITLEVKGIGGYFAGGKFKHGNLCRLSNLGLDALDCVLSLSDIYDVIKNEPEAISHERDKNDMLGLCVENENQEDDKSCVYLDLGSNQYIDTSFCSQALELSYKLEEHVTVLNKNKHKRSVTALHHAYYLLLVDKLNGKSGHNHINNIWRQLQEAGYVTVGIHFDILKYLRDYWSEKGHLTWINNEYSHDPSCPKENKACSYVLSNELKDYLRALLGPVSHSKPNSNKTNLIDNNVLYYPGIAPASEGVNPVNSINNNVLYYPGIAPTFPAYGSGQNLKPIFIQTIKKKRNFNTETQLQTT